MAATSSKNTCPDVPTSENKKTRFDFYFKMRPITVLKNAFQALGDAKFNINQEAVIQVGTNGCEITASNFDKRLPYESYGYLQLKKAGLEEFECRNPVRKVFELRGIPMLLKASEKFECDSVWVYVVEGSDKLSFQWGSTVNDFGLGQPLSIDLKDISSSSLQFPNFTYGFEAVFPSSLLRKMFVELRKNAMPWSTTVLVTLQPATMEMKMGNVTSGSLDGKDEEQEHRVSVDWQQWEALECASQTSTKCSVYLGTDPDTSIVLRFHLEELGDLVFLVHADFDDDPDAFPKLGHFGRLN